LSFIDSDCVVSEDYFNRVAETFETVDADAAGCMVDLPPSPHWIEKTWQDLHEHPKDGYVHFLNSGNFVIKKTVFEQSGGFNENLVTGEDAEYCQRLNVAGFKIYQSRAIRAMHLRNPKSLRAFLSKNVWHGLGMFGTFRHSWLDKPVLMTFVFLLFTAAGLVDLFLAHARLSTRVGALVILSLLAPVLTVLYRAMKARRLRRPIRSVLLYWLYFAARTYALFVLLLRHRKEGASV
jgi:GT2 family glycosyltransferase